MRASSARRVHAQTGLADAWPRLAFLTAAAALFALPCTALEAATPGGAPSTEEDADERREKPHEAGSESAWDGTEVAVWREEGEGEGEEETWQEEEDEDEEKFFEEEEEKETTRPALPATVGKHEIALEFRNTDIFDEPSPTKELEVDNPPDRLYYASYSTMPNHTNYVRFELEQFYYDGEDETVGPPTGEDEDKEQDTGWALISWDRTLATGARLYLDYGYPWAEDVNTGFWLTAEYGWKMGLNLDVSGTVQGSRNLIEKGTGETGPDGKEILERIPVWACRVGGEAKAALTEKTAVEVKGWYYWDGQGIKGSRQQAELAQYLAHRTGLHAQVRRNVKATPVDLLDDPYHEDPNELSVVATLEVRHRLREKNTVLRGSFRWYRDFENVFATGFSVGADHPFTHGSFGLHYRGYETNEDVAANSWWVALKLTF